MSRTGPEMVLQVKTSKTDLVGWVNIVLAGTRDKRERSEFQITFRFGGEGGVAKCCPNTN